MADEIDFGSAADKLMLRRQEEVVSGPIDFGAAADRMVSGKASVNLRAVAGENPDLAARARGLARQSGLPLPAVEGAEDRVESGLAAQRSTLALERAPTTRLFFTNPENAKIAHDDVENLSVFENVLAGMKQTLITQTQGTNRTIDGVTVTLSDALDYVPNQARKVLGLEPLKPLPGMATAIMDLTDAILGSEQRTAAVGDVDTGYQEITTWEEVKARPLRNVLPFIGEKFVVSLPDMALSMISLPALAASMTGRVAQDRVENDGREEATIGDLIVALPTAVSSAMLERFGARGVLGIDDALKGLGAGAIASAAGKAAVKEGATEFSQEFMENLGGSVGTERGFDLGEAVEAGIQGALVGTGAGGAIRSLTATGESLANSRRALQVREVLASAGEAADASALTQRAPDKFGELTGRVLRGQGVDKISIPITAIDEFLQNDEGSSDDIIRSLGIQDQIDDARLTGGDVQIEPEAYGEYILANPDIRGVFQDHIRLDPDGMTPAEADEFEQRGLKDEIERLTEALETADTVTQVEAAQIQTEVEAQLQSTGVSGDAATYSAVLTAHRYATRAERAGVSPLELWRNDNVSIRREEPGARPQVTNIDLAIDQLRSVSPESFLGLSATPALDILRRAGGVTPGSALAAELEARGITKADHRGLFKEGGIGAADNFPLSENPIFGAETDASAYVSEDAFLDAIDRELSGDPLRSVDEQNELQRLTGEAENLTAKIDYYNENLAGEAPIDINTSSNEEIKAAIAAVDNALSAENEFEQAPAVDSDAFKEWFGDSKVVDENGEPLVVYHGTNQEFDAFQRGAIFLSRSETAALTYGQKSMPVYVKIEDAVYFDFGGLSRVDFDGKSYTPSQLVSRIGEINDDLLNGFVIDDDLKQELDDLGWSEFSSDAIDGLVLQNIDDTAGDLFGTGEVATHYVAFKPTQIKSVHNRGTFDPNDQRILFQGNNADASPKLSALHNLSVENLIFADKMGGLAAPSIGVVRDDMGIEGYGGITLLGGRELVDPKETEVFDADAYTSTFVAPEYGKVKSAVAQKLVDEVRPWDEKYNGKRSAVLDDTWDYAVNTPNPEKIIERWLRDSATQAMYLNDVVGEVTPVPMRAVGLRYEGVSDNKAIVAFFKNLPDDFQTHGANSEANTKARREIVPLYRAALEHNYGDRKNFHTLTEKILADAIDKDGVMSFGTFDRLWNDQKAIGKTEIDSSKLEKNLREKIEGKEADFKKWVQEKVLAMFGEPFLKLRGKKEPYTLENIVAAMTKAGTRGKENTMVYGAGKVRAISARQFENVEEMRAQAKTNMMHPGELKEARDAAEKLLEDFRLAAVKHYTNLNYRGEIDTWGGFDDAMKAVAHWATNKKRLGDVRALTEGLRKNDFKNVPADVIEIGIEAGNALIEAPVPYFEAKPRRVVGLDEFSGAVVPDNVGDDVIEILERHNIAYKKYGEAYNEEHRSAAIRELRNEIGSDVLFQPGARGSIQFTPGETIIRLGANSDLSTFLHESGHLYLEQLRDDARQFGGVNGGLVDDWNTVIDWWAGNFEAIRKEAVGYANAAGDTDVATHIQNLSDRDIVAFIKDGDLSTGYLSRAMHEQWARGFEQYLKTGQAPSVSLQDAFNRFRAWLVSIYRAIKARRGDLMEVDISPEIRRVMDRLLATDEEISLVEEQYNLKAMFGSAEEIGMTPKQFETYQRLVAQATDEAKTTQIKKHLNEIEREQKKWWQDERAKMREAVAKEVGEQQNYRALHALARDEMPNGDVLPGGFKQSRLSKFAVTRILGSSEALARLPKVRGKGIYTTSSKESGTHPDVVAQMFGYDDGEAMLLDLINTQPIATEIDSVTDARMKQEFGDMLIDGTAVEKALEAAHGDKRSDVLVLELNALRDSQPKMKTSFIRQWARQRVGARKIDDIKPVRFLAAEKRFGREAGKLLKTGDRLGAQRAKFQQLLNHFMAREAYKVRAEVDKANEYFGKFISRRAKFKTIDADYIDQIRGILEAFNFMPRLSDTKRQKLMDWAEEKAREDGAIFTIPPEIAVADGTTHFRDMTLDEFRTLRDTIKNIEAQGRAVKTAIVDGEQREISEMASEIVAHVEELPQTGRQERKALEQNPNGFDKALGKLAGFDASLRKVEFLLSKIDGEQNGPAHKYIFQQFADAEAKRSDLSLAVTEKVINALNDLPKEVRSNLSKKVDVPLLGRKFARSDLLMMALNVGNESNYDKMIRGSERDITEGARAWTEEGIDEALSNLTAQEWDFVQTVWDAFEAMYPQVQAVYRAENGVSPERVEAREIETRYGQILRGGYFPMIYDPDRSPISKDLENKTSLDAMQSVFVKASVNSSMTKERTGFAAPVDLDITKLVNHIERTAHFITHYDAVRVTRALLGRQSVQKAITNRLGQEYFETIKVWMNELAAHGQPATPTSIAGRIVEAARTNATIAIMGFSYTTMASQVLGYANSVDALAKQPDGSYSLKQGSKWLATGLSEYLRNPAEARRKVFEQSGEMRHRLQNTDRDIRHALNQLSGKKGAWKRFQRFSLLGIAGVQLYVVDFPLWLGAYNQAIASGETGHDAVQIADAKLRMSQTAGGLKDLSEIQRERGVTSALTMFYSYFNLLYNLQAEVGSKVKNARDIPQAAARLFVLMAVPTAAEAIMRNEWPEDDEEYATWVSLKASLYALSSIPFVRDIAGVVDGFGYSVTPLDSFGDNLTISLAGLIRSFDEGEMDKATLKATVAAVGFIGGAPVTQTNRLINTADAMFEGEEVGPYDFLIGYKED